MSGCRMRPRLQLRTRRAEIKRFDSGGGVELLRHRPPPAEAERASNAGPHCCAPHVACASLDAMRWRMRRVAALCCSGCSRLSCFARAKQDKQGTGFTAQTLGG
jgi:hypothetical protein